VKEEPELRCVIQQNAKRVTELHGWIGETFKRRDSGPKARAEWSHACEEFHRQYDALAFPGGYAAGLEKLRAGDTYAIESALAFLEVRPYFFRSQYIRTKLKRLLKHAQLTARQTARLEAALTSERQWKRRSASSG
jgi:hypothetical protein